MRILLALIVLTGLVGCGQPHDRILHVVCISNDGSLKYELSQYTDRKDDATCTSSGMIGVAQFKYDGDASRYHDMCWVAGKTTQYIDGVAVIQETGERFPCSPL